jgi:WD40 repeat protein
LLSVDVNGVVVTWEAATSKRLRRQTVPGIAGSGPWQVVAYYGRPLITDRKNVYLERSEWPTLAGNGGLLLFRQDRSVRVFDLPTRKAQTFASAARYWQAAVSRDRQLLAVPDNVLRSDLHGDLLRLCDLRNGKELRSVAAGRDVGDGCFSPDGNWLAVYSYLGVTLWHVPTGTRVACCDGHRGGVVDVAFSPDGGTLVTAGADGTLVAWDVATLLAKVAR